MVTSKADVGNIYLDNDRGCVGVVCEAPKGSG